MPGLRLLLSVVVVLLIVACGDDSDSSNNPATAGGDSPTPASSTVATAETDGGDQAATVELSGPVVGEMSVQGMSCQPADAANLLVSISGTIGSDQYTIDIGATQAGTYDIAGSQEASAKLTQTSPGFLEWAAGYDQPDGSGSGSLTIAETTGSVDAVVSALAGNDQGIVRVQATWTCPQ